MQTTSSEAPSSPAALCGVSSANDPHDTLRQAAQKGREHTVGLATASDAANVVLRGKSCRTTCPMHERSKPPTRMPMEPHRLQKPDELCKCVADIPASDCGTFPNSVLKDQHTIHSRPSQRKCPRARSCRCKAPARHQQRPAVEKIPMRVPKDDTAPHQPNCPG